MKALAALLLIAAPAFASGTAKWEHDYQSAIKRAKAEKKVIFIYDQALRSLISLIVYLLGRMITSSNLACTLVALLSPLENRCCFLRIRATIACKHGKRLICVTC